MSVPVCARQQPTPAGAEKAVSRCWPLGCDGGVCGALLLTPPLALTLGVVAVTVVSGRCGSTCSC